MRSDNVGGLVLMCKTSISVSLMFTQRDGRRRASHTARDDTLHVPAEFTVLIYLPQLCAIEGRATECGP